MKRQEDEDVFCSRECPKQSEPYLSQTLLSCPHRCVDDLQEELSSSGIEDENGSIDGFCGQIPFKSLRKQARVRVHGDKWSPATPLHKSQLSVCFEQELLCAHCKNLGPCVDSHFSIMHGNLHPMLSFP